ncbi:MAG: hypothetical protein V4517_24095 [Pseudomonadota bacterium]|jgi:hypothetical protein
MRFWNNDVIGNMPGVLSAIETALTTDSETADRPPTPDLSPPQAGGGE